VHCPLLSPTSASLGKATISISCAVLLHEGLTSVALQKLVQRENMIPEMSDTTAVAFASSRNIIDILGKLTKWEILLLVSRPSYVSQTELMTPLRFIHMRSLAWSVLNTAQRTSTQVHR
jgi:hypothetical protein